MLVEAAAQKAAIPKHALLAAADALGVRCRRSIRTEAAILELLRA